MPSWDPKTNSFKGRVRIGGYPQTIKTGFRTKEDARRWELNTKHAIKTGQPVPEQQTYISFLQIAKEYLTYCKDNGYVDGTLTTKAQITRDFITFLGQDPPVESVDEQMIESYLKSIHNKKTANRHLREIKTAMNWMAWKKHIKENPCLSIKKKRETKYAPYVPSPGDINKVLMVANEFEYDFLQTIYHLSARRKEIMELKWSDIDFQNKTVAIWTRKRYGGQLERDLLKMNNVLAAILERRYQDKTCEWVFHRDGQKLKPTWIEHMLKPLCEKAGVERFGFHSIRHHVAALMAASKKLSIIDIQKQLRHKMATTTDHYLKVIVVEGNAASVIEEMQTGKQDSNIVPIPQKK